MRLRSRFDCFVCVRACVCGDRSEFGDQSCLDDRHLECVAVATKGKRLEADTVGSGTPSTETEAELKMFLSE